MTTVRSDGPSESHSASQPAPTDAAAANTPPTATAAQVGLRDRAETEQVVNRQLGVRDSAPKETSRTADLLRAQSFIANAPQTGLAAPTARPVKVTSQDYQAAESLGRNVGVAIQNLLQDGASIRSLRSLSGDHLIAAFLKLQINDPNNSPQTHQMLHELQSELRLQGIHEGQKRIANAEELKKEAEAFAEKAEQFAIAANITSAVIMVAAIVIAVVVTVVVAACTWYFGGMPGLAAGAAVGAAGIGLAGAVGGGAAATGAGVSAVAQGSAAAAQVAAQGFSAAAQAVIQMVQRLVDALIALTQTIITALEQAAQNAVIKAVNIAVNLAVTAVNLALQLTKTGVEHEAAMKNLDASQAENSAKRFRLLSEGAQADLDAEAEIIKIIMESRNAIMEAVVNMQKASHNSQMGIVSIR